MLKYKHTCQKVMATNLQRPNNICYLKRIFNDLDPKFCENTATLKGTVGSESNQSL